MVLYIIHITVATLKSTSIRDLSLMPKNDRTAQWWNSNLGSVPARPKSKGTFFCPIYFETISKALKNNLNHFDHPLLYVSRLRSWKKQRVALLVLVVGEWDRVREVRLQGLDVLLEDPGVIGAKWQSFQSLIMVRDGTMASTTRQGSGKCCLRPSNTDSSLS